MQQEQEPTEAQNSAIPHDVDTEVNQIYDVVVAGAGIAGILSAVRLAESNQNLRILILDKDIAPGGRIRCSGASAEQRGYGLNSLSSKLVDFWDATLQSDPEISNNLRTLGATARTTYAVVSGAHVTPSSMSTLLTPKGAKLIGGMAAAKQWEEVDKLIHDQPSPLSQTQPDGSSNEAAEADESKYQAEHSFASEWKLPKKAPAISVLDQYGPVLGIPDFWHASPHAIAARGRDFMAGGFVGNWRNAIDQTLERYVVDRRIVLKFSCRVIGAEQHLDAADPKKKHWVLETEQGLFRARSLLVAQPPWQGVQWLAKSYWPTALLAVASKTKPVSAVILTESLTSKKDNGAEAGLPDVILIPSEGVQALVTHRHEIAFQFTIDFEHSLQAPDVVKAVKALKRARRKFLHAFPGRCSETDHIALLPVAWAKSPLANEHRYAAKLGRAKLSTAELAFCGDAYGASYDGDENVIRSVVQACEALSKNI